MKAIAIFESFCVLGAASIQHYSLWRHGILHLPLRRRRRRYLWFYLLLLWHYAFLGAQLLPGRIGTPANDAAKEIPRHINTVVPTTFAKNTVNPIATLLLTRALS